MKTLTMAVSTSFCIPLRSVNNPFVRRSVFRDVRASTNARKASPGNVKKGQLIITSAAVGSAEVAMSLSLHVSFGVRRTPLAKQSDTSRCA